MNARTEKAELATRLATLAATNTLAAERDNAIMQRDNAVRENKGLQTQLRMALKERDEARALGRSA